MSRRLWDGVEWSDADGSVVSVGADGFYEERGLEVWIRGEDEEGETLVALSPALAREVALIILSAAICCEEIEERKSEEQGQ